MAGRYLELNTKPPMTSTPSGLESFERAFATNISGCVRACDCGNIFYDGHNQYDWEENELESLRSSPTSVELDYSVSTIRFEGKEFCADCSCWHERARKLIGFIERHAHCIAKFLNIEWKRKLAEANDSPEVI